MCKRSETVLYWHRIMKSTNNKFPNPTKVTKYKTINLPPLLDANPDIVSAIKSFCVENIDELGVEKV